MPERFDVSPVRIRPAGRDEAAVESGDRRLTVPVAGPPVRLPGKEDEEQEPIVRTGNPDPPFKVRLIRQESVLAELPGQPMNLGSATDLGMLEAWVARQDVAAERLDVAIDASDVSADELGMLAGIGSRHGLAIDVSLRDG